MLAQPGRECQGSYLVACGVACAADSVGWIRIRGILSIELGHSDVDGLSKPSFSLANRSLNALVSNIEIFPLSKILSLIYVLLILIMDRPHPCFVDNVIEPVSVISTGGMSSEDEMSRIQTYQFSTLDQIKSHFSRTDTNEQPYHFMYVLQELFQNDLILLMRRD